jgi:glycosyltransferase involved in cell wall biosynthesis
MLNAAGLGVVIPTRNSAATLEATLLSLMSQQRVTVTVVAVDSESSDATREICRRWGVRALSSPPGHMYRAINEGMRRLAACGWLAYLNSDDLVYPDGYARLIERGERCRADIVYGHGDFVDEAGAFILRQASFGPAIVCRQLAAGTMPFVQPAAVFRRAVFDRLGGFDERFLHIADYDFFARAADAGFRFGRAGGRPVAAFRVHDRQLSTVQKAIVDGEKAARRAAGGRHRKYVRMGLSTAWKVRNTFNYLAQFAQYAERGRGSSRRTQD